MQLAKVQAASFLRRTLSGSSRSPSVWYQSQFAGQFAAAYTYHSEDIYTSIVHFHQKVHQFFKQLHAAS